MPASTDTGPIDTPTDLIDLIRREPDAVEPGFHLVEIDLAASDARHIDLLGVDRHGVLTLLAVAATTPDDALLRLLDGYRWASDQYSLLTRACSLHRGGSLDGAGFRPDIRLLLLAPGFTHRFLYRLPLLTVPITPLLARRVSLGGDSRLLIEPAAALFGLRAAAMPAWEESPPPAAPRSFDGHFVDRALDGVLPAETPLEEAERAARESLDDLRSIDVPFASVLTPADRELFTETLTSEELDEFEQFEHQRRGGDGGLE